jgi:Helicase conserved C-terminal domain
MYIGVYMPGTGSIRSSEVRVGSALALAPMLLSEEERDPWWTNLWFFNDLKQLGTAISLFHNDIAKYMSGLFRRDGHPKRNLSSPEELTSRRQNSEIPRVLQQLSQTYIPDLAPNKQKAWDTCLASNIIEVGIDVDRLSLMTVVGQPKSTAQYIQVTGRVGRKWYERPGLVVTLYSMGRARDLSHFEHFRSYHERLYAQVEPTSVTPFAVPVVNRAIRGAITALIRTTLPQNKRPREITQTEFEILANVLRNRFAAVQGTSLEESEYLEACLEEAYSELSKWMRDDWEGQNGILRRQISDNTKELLTWTIPSSMRNVDAAVELSITDQYFEISPTSEGE